ncbi:MAG: tryptophan-rich sensory protein [Alphaproteobacteria bacterium]|nr:tryptophan-rich sensory protein [Alphaproteobacteria bacterium]
MTGTSTQPARRRHDLLALAGFIAVCLAVSGIGGAITATSVGDWYQALQKPTFNPPDWIFAPVWTTLYVLMATAAWRVWRLPASPARQSALIVFVLQLALNLLWSLLFFGLQRIDLGLIEIVILLVCIVATTILFWRNDVAAGVLVVPYVLWVGYASVLNGALWLLN